MFTRSQKWRKCQIHRYDGYVPDPPIQKLTVEQARKLVKEAQANPGWSILQLSRTYEITPEVAEALAEFQGEFLILGLTTIEPETAKALAKSKAGTVWLHSLTQMTKESAEALSELRGQLVLSGLTDLNSVALAKKLAQRPGGLSLPYVKKIDPEIADELANHIRSLTLAGLTDVSPELQEKLAETVGFLSLPNLKSLDSLPLTRKLAASNSVLLPGVERLSVEQAKIIVANKRPFYVSGILLSLAAMTPEVATVFADSPVDTVLALDGVGPISDEAFGILVKSPRLYLELQDVESLTDKQLKILAEAVGEGSDDLGQKGFKFSLPNLKKLDSALLAETLFKASTKFTSVKTISPAAAEAIGNLKDRVVSYGKNRTSFLVRPYGLSFPSLEELTPETARLLMNRSWGGISLPALRKVSPDTVRSLVRLTSNFSLGITSMSPEMAAVFSEMASNDVALGGGGLGFPCLTDLSPDAARILVKSLNRGVEKRGTVTLSRSPQLFFGSFDPVSFICSCPKLTPELAAELAKYQAVSYTHLTLPTIYSV